MKTINTRKMVLFLSFFTYYFSCKLQQLPLNTDFKNILMTAYLKDINNELPPYLGTYKANFQRNKTILYLIKTEKKLSS